MERVAGKQRVSREILWIAGLLLVVVAPLLGVTAVGVGALGIVRAYIAGESFYAKGQKDAAYHLMRYAQTRDPAAYERFQTAIEIPLADGRARALLEQGGSIEEVRRALVSGRNHPDDVDGMVMLFRRASLLSEMEEAIRLWTDADAEVAAFDRIARELHAEIAGGAPDPERVSRLVAELDGHNARLTEMQDAFSNTLSAGARRVRRLVLATAVVASVALLAIGLLSVHALVARLRGSEERLRSLLEHAHDIITIIRPDTQLEYTSPAIQRVLGYGTTALVGRSALDLIHPDDHAVVVSALARVVAEPGTTQDAEFRFRHADGGFRTLAATGRCSPGDVVRIVVCSRDVTDEKQLEAQLAQAQKMESIGRLAGGIAHDFNNLLTVIQGSAQLARAATDGAARAEIEQIEGAARRAANLTRQLLAFARRQVIEPRVFDLGELVRGMEDMLRRLVGARVELELAAGGEGSGVRADPGQIEQVIVNLVVNARDAMPDGGRLSIAIETVRIAAERRGGSVPAGEWVRIVVRDTGAAMSEEVQRHLFEPFFTTKAQGTGLGLATCYGIVKQNGGHISVESAPGRGTCFRIHLPHVARIAALPAAPRRDEPPGGSETVLLVEDEPAVRRIASLVLRERGYQVLEAADGHEGLRLAAEAGVEIDLLLSDVSMPRLGGRELGERLRAERPELRVLYMSGFTGGDTALHRDLEAAGLAFLPKPFSPSGLAQKVREVLDADKQLRD